MILTKNLIKKMNTNAFINMNYELGVIFGINRLVEISTIYKNKKSKQKNKQESMN
jgi:hypothetical protein